MKRIVLILASAFSVACARSGPSNDAGGARVDGEAVVFPEKAPQLSSFRVAGVGRSESERLTVTGRLVWDEDVTARVLPPVGGRVRAILADIGQRVRVGQRLATISSPDFGQAQSDAVRAAADLGAAERASERLRQLFERGAAPRKDLEQAESDLARTRAEAQRTRARLAVWGGAPADGAVDQDFALVSPLSGVVTERNLSPGLEVRTDKDTPLFVVSDPRRLWVLLDVTEQDLGAVVLGAPLTVRSPAYPGRTFTGTLRVLGSSLDPTTRTVRVRGDVRNADGLLKAEMYVSVDLIRKAESALVLPAKAVVHEGSENVVFVEESPGRYRRVKVTVGREQEGSVPVFTGLPGSARVVIEGALLLEATFNGGGNA